MSNAELPDPDKIPDMTIPDANIQPLHPVYPLARLPAKLDRRGWRAGDRVLAPWEPEFLYAGRVAQIDGVQALIEFDDGDAGWVTLETARKLVVKPGQRVLSRQRMSPQFFPATVDEVRGEQVLVVFADWPRPSGVAVAALRIPCLDTGPGAVPTQVASHRAFQEHLRPGDRIWAPWNNATLFVGTVDRVEGSEVHVHFDDGDAGWVQLEQVFPLLIPVGLRVMSRWKMGSQYFPGTVTAVEGERVFVQYDDGDREWTRPAALVVPCEPTGPNARPTRNATRWRIPTGWIITVVMIGLFVLTRSGCR